MALTSEVEVGLASTRSSCQPQAATRTPVCRRRPPFVRASRYGHDMTVNVSLRAVTQADLPALFENQRDPEATAMAAFPPRELDAFLAHRARIDADPSTVTRVIVVDDEVVGDIVSWVQDGDREIGYWVNRQHWGRGIATAAVAALLTEVTERPLYAHVVRHNAASVRVLEKCGFRKLAAHELPAHADTEEFTLRLDRAPDAAPPR